MDPAVAAAVIGGVATLVAAVVGAIVGQSGVIERIVHRGHITRLTGTWDSTWVDLADTSRRELKETFVIAKQKGSRITGYITMDSEPDKRWEFEGNFSGRFLQLYYFPSKHADNRLFLDYGCYFFDMQGDGSFKGYSVGFDWSENATDLSEHRLRRVR